MLIDDVSLYGNIDTQSRTAGVKESTASPFGNLDYNQGVVGPVILDDEGNDITNDLEMVFGNWPADGDLWRVALACNPNGTCTYTNTGSAVLGWPPNGVNPGRIQTMAFSNYACHSSGGTSCPVCPPRTSMLLVSVGTKIYKWTDGPRGSTCCFSGNCAGFSSLYADIGAAGMYTPDPNHNEQPIIGFISMSTDPLYGDVYFEGRDLFGNLEPVVLFVSNGYLKPGTPQRFFNVGEVAASMSLQGSFQGNPQPVPYVYGPIPEARSTAQASKLVRMTVPGPNQNPSFTNLPLWP
jgi:hypothetical protein